MNERKWSLEEIDELLLDSGAVKQDTSEIPDIAAEPIVKPEAVDPRPGHSERIEHKIMEQKPEKSDVSGKTHVFGALESDKYRERFLNKPMLNLEKTAEHTPVSEKDLQYERDGFIKREGHFRNTVELDPVPVLVSDEVLREESHTGSVMTAEKLDKTKTMGLRKLAVTNGNAHETTLEPEEPDTQLSFEGFDEPDEVEKVDEAQVEAELKRRREKIVDTFEVTNEALHPAEDVRKREPTEEYRNPNDKLKIDFLIKKRKNSAIIETAVTAVCFVLLLLLSFAGTALSKDPDFFMGEKLILIVSLLLLAVAGVAGRRVLWNGMRSMAPKTSFGRDTGCFLAFAAALLQNIVLLFSASAFEKGISLYGAVAVIPLGLNLFSNYIEQKRIAKNFRFASGEDIWSIGPIEKKEAAFEVGRGLLLDDPEVISCRKTQFPMHFCAFSSANGPADELSKKLTVPTLAVSVIIFVITALISKDFVSGITAFCAAMCVSAPVFLHPASCAVLSRACGKLLKKGAMLSGWEAQRMCQSANGVAVDSAEVFDPEAGNIFGIKTFSTIKVDDAILDTAALLIESGGPLGNLFRRVILGKTDLLPPVDTLAYEDKLGLSAWIQNRRVLVGSRELLRNHNVEVPEKSYVDRFLHDGRYPLFLAVEGKIAAMFIVSYDIEENNAKLLRKIERNSLSLLIRTDDANVTDEMISKELSIPKSGIKVLSAISGDILKSYRAEGSTASPAVILSDGKTGSFLSAIAAALDLGEVKHTASVLQIGAVGIGLAFVAAFSFVSGLSQLSCFQIAFTELIFTAIGFAAVRRRSL